MLQTGAEMIPIQTSVNIISKKVIAFYAKMNRVAEFLEKNNAPKDIQIDTSEVFLQYYIDEDALNRLIHISKQDGFAQFGVFFGLEDPNDQNPPVGTTATFGRITSCFLGVDSDNNILGCHFPKIPVGTNKITVIDGEDTWPPPPPNAAEEEEPPTTTNDNEFTLDSDEGAIRDYFNTDVSEKSAAK